MIGDLRRLSWTKGLDEEAIDAIVEKGEFLRADEGDIVHRADETLT